MACAQPFARRGRTSRRHLSRSRRNGGKVRLHAGSNDLKAGTEGGTGDDIADGAGSRFVFKPDSFAPYLTPARQRRSTSRLTFPSSRSTIAVPGGRRAPAVRPPRPAAGPAPPV